MYEQLENPKENKRRSVVNQIPLKNTGGEPVFKFLDNRPEVIAKRKPQELSKYNRNQSSNVVIQLMSVAETAIITDWVHGAGRAFWKVLHRI